jgi:hypothetical protein
MFIDAAAVAAVTTADVTAGTDTPVTECVIIMTEDSGKNV